jgi:hypothetical protein
MPASGVLERAYYPTPERLAQAMRRLLADAPAADDLLVGPGHGR